MKLSQTAITKIDNLNTRLAIAGGLQFTETWVNRLIRVNKENGPLTTAKALQVISENTGMSFNEILEEEVNVISTQS